MRKNLKGKKSCRTIPVKERTMLSNLRQLHPQLKKV